MAPYQARFPKRKDATNHALAEATREIVADRVVGVVLDTHRWRTCRALAAASATRPEIAVPNPAATRREFRRAFPPKGTTLVPYDLSAFLADNQSMRGRCNVAYFDYCGLYGPGVRRDIRAYFATHARPGAPGVFAVTCCTRGAGQTQARLIRCLRQTVSHAARAGAGLRCRLRAQNLYQHVSLVFELSPVDAAPPPSPSGIKPKGAWTPAPASCGLPPGWLTRRKTCSTGNHWYAPPDFAAVFRSARHARGEGWKRAAAGVGGANGPVPNEEAPRVPRAG